MTATATLTKSRQVSAPYTGASPSYTPSLGANLEAINYYSTALPLLDLMKGSSGWLPQNVTTYNTGENLNLDANGYVTSIPATADAPLYDRVGITLLLSNPAALPNTHYVVLYQGEGTIQGALGTTVIASESTPGHLVVQAATDGSVQLQLLSTDPNHTGNYIHDMHVVRQDLLPLYQSGLSFNPDFLSKSDNFHTLRFMDWMNTNQIFDHSGNPIGYDAKVGWANVDNAPLLAWADRPKMTDANWSHGIPVEALVEAANRSGTDVWFNMPTNASDDYVRGFAQYVKDHLDPGLRIHVEYSNEVWNFGFPQSEYAMAQAHKVLGPNGNWMEWYGMRTAQIGAIWKDTFGEPETGANPNGLVSVVFNTQLEYKGLETYGLETASWKDANGTHIRAADYFDEYAVTGYYGNIMSNDADVATVKSWWSNPDGGYTAAINALAARIQSYNAPLYQYHAAEANAYGLSLVTYESGFGEQTPQSELNDPAYTNFLATLQRDPRIYAIEQANFAAFKAAGGTLYNNFEVIAAPSRFGSWGALESVNQATSARYQALSDWNASVAPWYETGRDPTTFQNSRFYQAGNAGETIAGTLHGYDVLIGGAGNDTFVPYGTGTAIDGEGGVNTAVLPGALASYTFTKQVDGSILANGYGESFTIRNIQLLIGNDASTMSTGAPVLGTGTSTSPSMPVVTPTPPVAVPPVTNNPAVIGPTVSSVAASGSGIVLGAGSLKTAAVVTLTLNLSQVAYVSGGIPTLTLNDGGVATYKNGSGSNALTFSYVVAAGESTTDLTVTGVKLNGATVSAGTPTVAVGSGKSLVDANGHVFTIGGVYKGADHFILRDGLQDGIGISLVLVNGTVWDHTSSIGWYSDRSGSWTYQASAPNLQSMVAADLSGAVGNPAGLLQINIPPPVTAPATTSAISTSLSPVVMSLVATGNGIIAGSGDLHPGSVVTLTANLSQSVSVTGGTPTLILNDGGVATYVGGSGSGALKFRYVVAAGESTADLAVTSVKLNNATVSTGTPTIAVGSGQSLTDANGHVFTFGEAYKGADHYILRDGQVDGAGVTLALVNGIVWDRAASTAWFSDHGGSWAYEGKPPAIIAGTIADLSGAVTNPTGILHIEPK